MPELANLQQVTGIFVKINIKLIQSSTKYHLADFLRREITALTDILHSV